MGYRYLGSVSRAQPHRRFPFRMTCGEISVRVGDNVQGTDPVVPVPDHQTPTCAILATRGMGASPGVAVIVVALSTDGYSNDGTFPSPSLRSVVIGTPGRTALRIHL